jgi:aryl-alcohol dehydrogenase-like predicted oxidoreductase
MHRQLGRSGIDVSAMGLGCWAIGGSFSVDGKADAYGDVDDDISIRAISEAIDLGVTFFDTSDAYGTGHSEEILGRAVAAHRDRVVIATKFGYSHDATRRELTGTGTSPRFIQDACDASLKRLSTDRIDLYQLHLWSIPMEAFDDVFGTLDQLRDAGKIREYGWSTGDPDNALALATRTRGTSILHPLNVFSDEPGLIAIAEEHGLASISSMPLAMGILSGKFDARSRVSTADVRGAGHDWVEYFENGRPRTEFLDMLDGIRDVLTSGGRTVVQGALAWLWARSENTIPIPGFKTIQQVRENADAMRYGPLSPGEMVEIQRLREKMSS